MLERFPDHALPRDETRGAGRSWRDRGRAGCGASRWIAHRLPEIPSALHELKYRRLSAGRVGVGALGTPAPLMRVVARAPWRPPCLALLRPSKLLEVEIRVGRLRVILGGELEDEGRAGRFAHRQLRGASLATDRDLR